MAEIMPSPSSIPLTIIVAATTKNGIGRNGGLPWPMLKKDMAYFARVTKRLPAGVDNTSPHRNVVIMGRKTWDSIPTHLRPLKGRTNVVITSQRGPEHQDKIHPDVVLASGIEDGLSQVLERGFAIGRAFVIGGTSIYRAAMELPQTRQALLTRIRREYECDTFFPVVLGQDSTAEEDRWQRSGQERLNEIAGESVEEGWIEQGSGDEKTEIEFQLFERH